LAKIRDGQSELMKYTTYEVGPVIQEVKDPAKIKRALAQGCAGVLVDNEIPAAVTTEIEACFRENDDVVRRLQDSGLALIPDREHPTQYKWSRDEPRMEETFRWFAQEFDWAVSAGLTKSVTQRTSETRSLLRTWFNQEGVGQLPWHIDRRKLFSTPDIHMHVYGKGMVLASPRKTLALMFSDSEGSPNLRMRDMPPYQNTGSIKIIDNALTSYLKERGFTIIKMKPGQELFFNEGCLHKSSSGQKHPKVRGAIF